MPEFPEDLKSFRIDFVPMILFGSQRIAIQDQVYYAEPLKIAGSQEMRPNFVQVSNFDRAIASWNLSVRQETQFQTDQGGYLAGAVLSFSNAEVISVHSQKTPDNYSREVDLIPEETSQLFKVDAGQGAGTWIYRLGNSGTMFESVKLSVPGNAAPSAKKYKTTLVWTISIIP